MLIRRETPGDIDTIRAVTAEAFTGLPHSLPPVDADGVPGEATLVTLLRDGPGWIPSLSLVAEDVAGRVVGHAMSTRGDVDGVPALGLGPVSVIPGFGFLPAASLGIAAPDHAWGDLFQVRTLAAYDPSLTGTFHYAPAFETIG